MTAATENNEQGKRLSEGDLVEIEAKLGATTATSWVVVAGDEPDADFFICTTYPGDEEYGSAEDRIIGRWSSGDEPVGVFTRSHRDVLFIVDAHNHDVASLIAEIRALWAAQKQWEVLLEEVIANRGYIPSRGFHEALKAFVGELED